MKLGDFGISLAIDDENIKISKTIGSELYNSPEFNKENLYNQKSDIWYLNDFLSKLILFKIFGVFLSRSLGVSFYELSVFELPFKFIDDISHKPFLDLKSPLSNIYNSLIKK